MISVEVFLKAIIVLGIVFFISALIKDYRNPNKNEDGFNPIARKHAFIGGCLCTVAGALLIILPMMNLQ